jgi:3'(2'), 5'-bisphosphate nucleotidase
MQYKGISHTTPEQLLSPVLEIARQASGEILKVYNSDFDVERKDDNSPLTAADMAAHNTISKALKKLTPDVPILSEESAGLPYSTRKAWETYWLVDPLDGTKEFIKKNGEFTVNIALINNYEPILGVVHVPVTDVGYFASVDSAAFKQSSEEKPVEISARRASADALTVAGSRSHANEVQQRFFAALGPDTETINRGSSLKFCLIAEGVVDVYGRFGPTSEWDTAAAHCVVRQAGGEVSDLQLQALKYNTKDSVLNPHFLVMGDPGFDWGSYLKAAGAN